MTLAGPRSREEQGEVLSSLMSAILIDLPDKILTPRVLLRHPLPGDGPVLNEAVCLELEYLRPWMPWAKTAPTVAESEELCSRAYARWILRDDLWVLMFDRETGRFLGGTGLHHIRWDVPSFAIGYWIREGDQGKGLVTETTLGLTHFAFNFLGAKRVEILCDERNQKSAHIPERLGFQLEGTHQNFMKDADGVPRNSRVYARLDTIGLPSLDVSWH